MILPLVVKTHVVFFMVDFMSLREGLGNLKTNIYIQFFSYYFTFMSLLLLFHWTAGILDFHQVLLCSGVITSGDITDSPVMKKMEDNRGLMIIREAYHKHIQPLTLAYFRRDLIKIW